MFGAISGPLRFTSGAPSSMACGIDLQTCGQPPDAGSNHRASREGRVGIFPEARSARSENAHIRSSAPRWMTNSATGGPDDFLW